MEFNRHALQWTATGGVVEPGTLPGATTGQASGIDNAGLAVGQSCNAGGVWRGFPWVQGAMRRR